MRGHPQSCSSSYASSQNFRIDRLPRPGRTWANEIAELSLKHQDTAEHANILAEYEAPSGSSPS